MQAPDLAARAVPKIVVSISMKQHQFPIFFIIIFFYNLAGRIRNEVIFRSTRVKKKSRVCGKRKIFNISPNPLELLPPRNSTSGWSKKQRKKKSKFGAATMSESIFWFPVEIVDTLISFDSPCRFASHFCFSFFFSLHKNTFYFYGSKFIELNKGVCFFHANSYLGKRHLFPSFEVSLFFSLQYVPSKCVCMFAR
jgi:hypothetical protein